MGSDWTIRGGAAHGLYCALRDGRDDGHERQFAAFVAATGTSPSPSGHRPGGLSERRPGRALPGGLSSTDPGPVVNWTSATGGLGSRRVLAPSRGPGSPSRAARTTRWSRSPSRTPRPTRPGPASATDRGGVGVRRPRRDRGGRVRLGDGSCRRPPRRQHLAGGLPVAEPPEDGYEAPARGLLPPTATSSTRSAATSGNGRPTGTPRSTPPGPRGTQPPRASTTRAACCARRASTRAARPSPSRARSSRVAPSLRPFLLPPLPPGGAPRADDRQRVEPHRLPCPPPVILTRTGRRCSAIGPCSPPRDAGRQSRAPAPDAG